MIAELLTLGIEGLQVLIVDDNSPDGTGNIANDLGQIYPNFVQVLHRPQKKGLGTAYIEGFKLALSKGADYIIEMDADFSHSPRYIPVMLDKIRDYDIVVGSRYVDGGQVDERWGWWRQFLSWWANSVYVHLILGTRVRDATAGFKCFRREVLERLPLEQLLSSGYIFQVEVAYLCEKMDFRIVEIPIVFEDRAIGQSKMTVPVKIEAALRAWEIKWRYRKLKSNRV